MRSPVPPKKLSEKSREESCFIAAKDFSDCLRRHRRLLHPAKDNRTQPIFYDRAHAQMSRAKLRGARKRFTRRRQAA
jgi:hypothetical protein